MFVAVGIKEVAGVILPILGTILIECPLFLRSGTRKYLVFLGEN